MPPEPMEPSRALRQALAALQAGANHAHSPDEARQKALEAIAWAMVGILETLQARPDKPHEPVRPAPGRGTASPERGSHH